MSANTHLRAAAFALAALLLVPLANAAEQTRNYLYTKFENGDIPTGQDFKDVIDSALNYHDDGLIIYRVGADSAGNALRFDVGAVVNGLLSYAPASDHPLLAPNWLGQSGFLPLELRDTNFDPHYAYLRLQMAGGPVPPAPGQPGPAIFVESLVYESEANTPLTTLAGVPEPTSAVIFGLVTFTGIAMSARRRW